MILGGRAARDQAIQECIDRIYEITDELGEPGALVFYINPGGSTEVRWEPDSGYGPTRDEKSLRTVGGDV